MKAPDEFGINKDFTEKSTDWIATDSKRETLEYCTMIFNKPKGWSNYARNNNKIKIKEMRMLV